MTLLLVATYGEKYYELLCFSLQMAKMLYISEMTYYATFLKCTVCTGSRRILHSLHHQTPNQMLEEEGKNLW